MRIDFSAIPDQKQAEDITCRSFASDTDEIVPCRVHPGGQIKLHRHDDGEEVCYVLYGNGEAVLDGKTEPLATDICHICPMGSAHEIRNTGNTDLVMLTVHVKR